MDMHHTTVRRQVIPPGRMGIRHFLSTAAFRYRRRPD
jgi:hypothetical protein